jgi:hypothetical protein
VFSLTFYGVDGHRWVEELLVSLPGGQLGFLIFDLERQFIAPKPRLGDESGHLRFLEEVRHELGFIDLIAHDGPYDPLVARFRRVLPSVLNAGRYTARWAHYGSQLVDQFLELRQAVTPPQRQRALNNLRRAVRDLGGDARW